MKKNILIILSFAFLFSCGSSKEEISAKEKYFADSVAKVTIIQMENKRAKEDSIANIAVQQILLKEDIIQLKAQLEAEKVKLIDIEQFKLLRTPDEKQQQVKEQTIVIEKIKQQIIEIEKQIIN